MNADTLPVSLAPIIRYLESLTTRAPLEELRELLGNSVVTLEDLRALAQFDEQHYRRNVVAESPWFSLMIICWRSGQRSPIHDHAGSSCAFKVMTGVCSETVYEFGPCGQVFPIHTTRQPVDAIVATEDGDTHQVSNLQPRGQDLVTLHIYSPPLKAMHVFSILGEKSDAWKAPEAGNDVGNFCI